MTHILKGKYDAILQRFIVFAFVEFVQVRRTVRAYFSLLLRFFIMPSDNNFFGKFRRSSVLPRIVSYRS